MVGCLDKKLHCDVDRPPSRPVVSAKLRTPFKQLFNGNLIQMQKSYVSIEKLLLDFICLRNEGQGVVIETWDQK